MRTLTKIGAGVALTALALTGCSADAGDEKPVSVPAETETVEEEAPGPTKCADEGTVYGDVIAVTLVDNPERGYSCALEVSPNAEVRTRYEAEEQYFEVGGTTEQLQVAQDHMTDLMLSILNAQAGSEDPSDPSMTDSWWAEDAPKFLSPRALDEMWLNPTPEVGETSSIVSTKTIPPSIYDAKSRFSNVDFVFSPGEARGLDGDATIPYLKLKGEAIYSVRVADSEAFDKWLPAYKTADPGSNPVATINGETKEYELEQYVSMTLYFPLPFENVLENRSGEWAKGIKD